MSTIVTFSLWLTLIVLLASIDVACSKIESPPVPSELILFSSIGNRPFQDSVYAIDTNGTNLKKVLVPAGGRSYPYASGNSFSSELVVEVHELQPNGDMTDKLFLYHPVREEWKPLEVDGDVQGNGSLSPDGAQAAFVKAPSDAPGKLRIWVKNLKTGEVRAVANEDGDFWDGYLSWSPNNQDLVFLRLQRTPRGLLTLLLRSSPEDKTPTIVFGHEEGISAACYSPDGTRLAVFSKIGLEIVELLDLKRTLILSWDGLPNPQFRTGGLIWSGQQNKIAFAMSDKQEKECNLWTISSDGKDLRKIYGQPENDGYLIACSFIRS